MQSYQSEKPWPTLAEPLLQRMALHLVPFLVIVLLLPFLLLLLLLLLLSCCWLLLLTSKGAKYFPGMKRDLQSLDASGHPTAARTATREGQQQQQQLLLLLPELPVFDVLLLFLLSLS